MIVELYKTLLFCGGRPMTGDFSISFLCLRKVSVAVVCLKMFSEDPGNVKVRFGILPIVFHDVRERVEFISFECFDFVPHSSS